VGRTGSRPGQNASSGWRAGWQSCLSASAILRLRFEQDLTQRDFAARLWVSLMHVSQLLRESLERL
jgi:DNA-binding transcriptional regulator LsrR (DeoR family)